MAALLLCFLILKAIYISLEHLEVFPKMRLTNLGSWLTWEQEWFPVAFLTMAIVIFLIDVNGTTVFLSVLF